MVNATFNVFVFNVNASGTVCLHGHRRRNSRRSRLSDIPDGDAFFGFIIVNPTGTGNFVGGTTALDDGTVVPNARLRK